MKKGTQSFSLPFARTSRRLTQGGNYFIFAQNEKQYITLLKIRISMSVRAVFFFLSPHEPEQTNFNCAHSGRKAVEERKRVEVLAGGRGGKIHLSCGRY